jgi:hypothetical protein
MGTTILNVYANCTWFMLPLFGALWMLVCQKWLQVRKQELGIGLVASLRESYVMATVGRSPARRALQSFVSAEQRWYAALYGTGALA